MVMKLNKAAIHNMSDKELCIAVNQGKPPYELEGHEFLVAELAVRLSSLNSLYEVMYTEQQMQEAQNTILRQSETIEALEAQLKSATNLARTYREKHTDFMKETLNEEI